MKIDQSFKPLLLSAEADMHVVFRKNSAVGKPWTEGQFIGDQEVKDGR
jgi:hypothetical protein